MVLNRVSDRVLPGTLLHSVLEERFLPQRLFGFTVEFADVPRLSSLELVCVRDTTHVLCLQRVLVRSGDEGIIEALRPRSGKSSTPFTFW